MNLTVITLTPTQPRFEWGTDGVVVWIEELDNDSSVATQMTEVLDRIGFAVELQTGWDHRTDGATFHPLYGYRILFRDAQGLWHAVQTDEGGHYSGLVPLQEMDYEIAYEKVMWIDA